MMMFTVVSPFPLLSEQPVIWRASQTPVTQGHNQYHLMIKFESPCNIFTTDNIHEHLLKEAKSKCEELYEEYFLRNVEEMCPRGTFTEVEVRKKRELFTLLTVFIISIAASAAFGIAGTTVASINAGRITNIQTKFDEQEKKLEQDAERLNLAEKAIQILQENYKTLHGRFGELEQDYLKIKYSQVGTTYAVSYITTRLLNAQQTLKETSRQWKENKVNPAFFDYLNFTLPCEGICPLKNAIAQQCKLSYDKTKLYMKFTTPVVDTKLRLLEADPFDLIHKTENETCVIKYSGPRNVIISAEEDCVYSVNVKYSDIILSPGGNCKQISTLPDTSTYFSLLECKPKRENDEWKYVQIKLHHGQYHIYCNGNNVTIGKVTQRCPDQPFVIPVSTDFFINEHFYKAGEYKINHQEVIDPLFTIKANWYLQPKNPMDKIIADINLNRKVKENPIPSNGFELMFWIYGLISLLGVIVLFIIGYLIRCVINKRNKRTIRANTPLPMKKRRRTETEAGPSNPTLEGEEYEI